VESPPVERLEPPSLLAELAEAPSRPAELAEAPSRPAGPPAPPSPSVGPPVPPSPRAEEPAEPPPRAEPPAERPPRAEQPEPPVERAEPLSGMQPLIRSMRQRIVTLSTPRPPMDRATQPRMHHPEPAALLVSLAARVRFATTAAAASLRAGAVPSDVSRLAAPAPMPLEAACANRAFARRMQEPAAPWVIRAVARCARPEMLCAPLAMHPIAASLVVVLASFAAGLPEIAAAPPLARPATETRPRQLAPLAVALANPAAGPAQTAPARPLIPCAT